MDIWVLVASPLPPLPLPSPRRISGEVYKLNKVWIQESELWIGSFNQPELSAREKVSNSQCYRWFIFTKPQTFRVRRDKSRLARRKLYRNILINKGRQRSCQAPLWIVWVLSFLVKGHSNSLLQSYRDDWLKTGLCILLEISRRVERVFLLIIIPFCLMPRVWRRVKSVSH